jgi:hypothetical protein
MSIFEIIVVILLCVLCITSLISISLKNNIDNQLKAIQLTLEIFNRHNGELTQDYRSEVRLAIDELCDLQRDNNNKNT